jgi:NAD(P)-dependent dehydrogenase (short-subunit alcohol dehydrogenase family)
MLPLNPPPPPARTALVTGAGKRLGREIALALARGGWQVAVHYRHSEQDAIQTVADCADLTSASDLKHHYFQADLADETAVRCLLPRVVAYFGAVDAVVNCASTFEHDSAATFGFAAMEQHLRSNTGAPILLAQALHSHLLARAAQHGAVANTMLAQALAPQVRVVGVAPGLTLKSHMLSDEQFAALHQISPLGRSSTAADVAATVKFALENASITGTTLLVDGGQHLMQFERDFSLM